MTSVDGAPPSWVTKLEALHGLPIELVPATVYILCWKTPQIVKSVSSDYGYDGTSAKPITHYVGWTSQANPYKRINNHSLKAWRSDHVYLFTPATLIDEEDYKRNRSCPGCGTELKLSLVGPDGYRP